MIQYSLTPANYADQRQVIIDVVKSANGCFSGLKHLEDSQDFNEFFGYCIVYHSEFREKNEAEIPEITALGLEYNLKVLRYLLMTYQLPYGSDSNRGNLINLANGFWTERNLAAYKNQAFVSGIAKHNLTFEQLNEFASKLFSSLPNTRRASAMNDYITKLGELAWQI